MYKRDYTCNESPILPCGKVNVKTGKFKYGNFYGFWGDDTCYEVYKTVDGRIRVVATAGTESIVKVGERSAFCHDQTRRYLFTGEVIETVVGDEGFKTLGEKYGNQINVATYK